MRRMERLVQAKMQTAKTMVERERALEAMVGGPQRVREWNDEGEQRRW